MSFQLPSSLKQMFDKKAKPNGIATIQEIMDGGMARSVFQPIVDLKKRQTFAYEALARCSIEAYRSPPDLLDAAVQAGMVGQLGRYLRQKAIDACKSYPLFINIHPHEFEQGWLSRPDDPIFWHNEDVYLEITESVPLHYFEQCHSVLAEARSKGIRLAVDDLGAGYSNLKYISDLAPEVVKLDRELIVGLRKEGRQFQLVCSIIQLCVDMGAKVVAEGIETIEELQAVMKAGAHYGQGFLFARPAFPAPIAVWPGDSDPIGKDQSHMLQPKT